MREYLLVLLVAATVTYLLAGAARTIAVRTGAMATVRSRDVHTQPIPYYGGVAMLGGLAVAFWLALQLPFLGRHAAVAHDASAVLWAGLVIAVIGVLDDKYDMPALVKLGTLSYGIYLWHYPVVRYLRADLPWPVVVGLGLAISTALSALSFYTLERWVMRYRDGLGGSAAVAKSRDARASQRHPNPGQPVAATALR